MKKTFEVDWDNPSDLKKLTGVLQGRRKTILRQLGYDQIYFNGSKYNMQSILPAFEKMAAMDFSSIYNQSDENKSFYVYAHCNPLKPLNAKNDIKHLFLVLKYPSIRYEPFYIGKGTRNRWSDLQRNDTHWKIRQNIRKYNKDVEPLILKNNLTESQAFSLESILIDILGLKSLSNFGLLCNLDEGVSDLRRRALYNDPMVERILQRNGFKS